VARLMAPGRDEGRGILGDPIIGWQSGRQPGPLPPERPWVPAKAASYRRAGPVEKGAVS
jgi:hypothetical protein